MKPNKWKLTTRGAALILSAAFLSHCQSTKPADVAALDVAKPAPKEPKVVEVLAALDPKNSKQIPSEALFNWTLFFKPLPASTERPLLEKKLARLKTKDDTSTLREKARLEISLGYLVAAEATLREVIRREPNVLEDLLELAQVFLRQGQFDHAMDTLAETKEVIASKEAVAPALIFRYRYALALTLHGKKEYQQGNKILSDLIGERKDFVPAYVALANGYIQQGRLEVALFVTRRGLDRAGDDAAFFNLMGVIHERQGKSAEARQWFNRAVASNGTYVAAMVNRAGLNIREGDLDVAEEDLKKAIELDPYNTDAYVALGIIYRKTGRFAMAKGSLEKALSLKVDHSLARFNLAVLLADEFKDRPSAVRLFNEVTQTADASAELKTMAKQFLDNLKTYH